MSSINSAINSASGKPNVTSDVGIDLIKSFEGKYLKAYRCQAGVWTIGYGHTGRVRPGQTITEKEAEEILQRDLKRFEEGVKLRVAVPLTQNQFDALVSFSFNVGLGALGKSTLLKKLNAGKVEAAADEFLRWNKAGGRVLRGLVKRRQAEKDLFLTP